ncbi:MAG: DUF1326 domain-containing protein [Tepidiformaceae bacterium]
MTTATKTTWKMKGDALGACSCDWGCPCNFDAPPSKGWCEGGYSFHINSGSYNDVGLDGLTIGFFAHSPAALHLGNVTGYVLIDERATEEQRQAIMNILGGQYGGVFGVLASMVVKVIGPDFVPIQWKFDGPNSYCIYGDKAELRLAEIKNPVTGEPSAFSLKMSNGLLTNQAELMASSVFKINHPELSYDHSGQYGETFQFDYAGEG